MFINTTNANIISESKIIHYRNPQLVTYAQPHDMLEGEINIFKVCVIKCDKKYTTPVRVESSL